MMIVSIESTCNEGYVVNRFYKRFRENTLLKTTNH